VTKAESSECVRRLDQKSRMSCEVHVRFRERLGVRFPRATRPNVYVQSQRAGLRVMASLTRCLDDRLRWKVTQKQSVVDRPWHGTFLGDTVTNHLKPR